MEYDSRTERLPHDQQVCALVQDLLPLYIEDEVSGQSRAMIVAHLNECAHCAGFLRGARSARMQFERERERAGTQRRQETVGPLLGTLLVRSVGALCLAAFAFFTVLALGQVLSGTYSSWVTPLVGSVTIHTLFVVFCLIALGIVAWQLIQPKRARSHFALVAAIGGVFAGAAPLTFSRLVPPYSIIGATVLVASLVYLWVEREQLGKLGSLDIAKSSGGLVLNTIAILAVIAVLQPRGSSFSNSPADMMPTNSSAYGEQFVTPTPVAAVAYPAPVMGFPTPKITPTPTIAPTVTPTVVAQP